MDGNQPAWLLNHQVCPELREADARAQQTFFSVSGSYVDAEEACPSPEPCLFLTGSTLLRVFRIKVI